MDGTVVGHVLIAVLNLLTALVSWTAGKRRGKNGKG